MKKNLIIENGEKTLTVTKSKRLVGSFVTLEKIQTYLSKPMPDEIKGYCKKKKYYIGHGVCLYYKFLKKESMCGNCDADEIVKQLNYILEKETGGTYKAFWKAKQKRKRRKKKNV